MRHLALLVPALLASCSSLPRPWGEGVDLWTQLHGGYRALVDHPTYEGHPVVGLEFATEDRARDLGYELGAFYGEEDEGGPSNQEGEIDEVYLGLRRTFGGEEGPHPFVGAGLSWARVENFLDNPTRNFDDDSGGAYVHGGMLWKWKRLQFDRGTDLFVGFDARVVVGDEVDLAQLALVLSFGR
jgi:hypothetical protein